MPFRNITGSGLFWKREESLANAGFRYINAGLDEHYGQISQQSELSNSSEATLLSTVPS